MDEEKILLLKKWLMIEFYYIADKANLIHKKINVDEQLIFDTIHCLDYETIMNDSLSVNYIITIIALMWEHVDHKKYDLRQIIIKFLSRIGYPTSAIITDEGFNKDDCSFTSLNSIIDEIVVTINQEFNEIDIFGHKYLLTNFQKNIWSSMDIDKVIGISAPTSAGKSFVILLKLVKRLCSEKIDVVYIVPTLSLLNQVTEDFNRELKKFQGLNYWISNSFEEDINDYNHIYVLTQEKAIAAFSNIEKAFSNKLILVADEIQNIERIKEEKDERAKILFDTLMEFRYKSNVEQIIVSGPRIVDIDKVGKSIFGIETKDHTTEISPVLNLTYSIRKIDKKYYFKQYCNLMDQPIIEEIRNISIIKGYGQKRYTDNYLGYLCEFVLNTGNNEQNIIFAPTAKGARTIAMSLETGENGKEKELVEYYSKTIHKNYTLCKTISKGVAYHHGKLPVHVRRTLEKAISDKRIKNVVCTTTLMQGVNLPAQNVFIRNPHLYIQKHKDSSELTNYEMANLRGRAGRLLKDFIGRTYVMDESEFINTDGYEQLQLFEDTTKELPYGYEQRFEEYRSNIEIALSTNIPVDKTMQKYGYLISYIRQSILRYGESSQKRMRDVGIKLTQKQVAAIILKLNSLSVPREICYRNRYWDPLVLDVIYTKYTDNVPVTPIEKGAKAKLDKMLKFLRDTNATSGMYDRYISEEYQHGQKRGILCSLCMDWAQEKPLKEILQHDRYNGEDGADNIENTIELLQDTISFSIPLLLKPIFDIKNPDSIFLLCMQVGAIGIATRNMIELGIARETALFLNENYFKAEKFTDKSKTEIEQIIRKKIKYNYSDMPYWIKQQLDFLI